MDMESMEIELFQTSMNKPLLIVNGYQHRIHRKNDKNISWLCLKERKEKCIGKVKTDLHYKIISFREHSCVTNVANIEIKKAIVRCKKRIREEIAIHVSKIFHEEISKLHNKGLAAKIPTYESVKTVLCRERRRVLGNIKNSKTCNELEFPNESPCLPNTATNSKKHLMTTHPEVQIQQNTVVLQDDTADLLNRSADNKTMEVNNDCAEIREKRSSDGALLPVDLSIVKLKKVEPDFIFLKDMNSQTKKLIDNSLLSLFTKDLHKFSLIESEGFQAFVKALNPQYEIPDINTISERMLPDTYEKLKQLVDDALHNGLAITLCVDSWTNIFHHEHFIAIKANFLDHNNFDVMSVLLDIYCLSEKPTNEKLNEILRNVTSEWCITQKIALVVSNCVYETATDGWLQWDYISCVIHSINIIVTKNLESVNDLLFKVQSIVSCYKQNRFATSELLQNQENLGNAPDDLISSNLTDWYSIFSMLKQFVQLEDFFKTYVCHLDLSVSFLTKEEWNVCREIVEVIKPFETFIKSLSEEKYLTSSLAIILSKGLETMLKKLSAKSYHDITHNFLSKCIEETVNQFNNLYSNNILLISTFLDPRFKDIIFESNVKEKLKQSIINIVATNSIPPKEENISISEESISDDSSLSIWEAFQSKASQFRPTGTKMISRASFEIQQYLGDGLLPRNENPVQWWKNNGHMYPLLKNLMKQNLAVTCTSVSSDLFFSKLSQTLKERRSLLSIEEAKMILFMNSNQHLLKIE